MVTSKYVGNRWIGYRSFTPELLLISRKGPGPWPTTRTQQNESSMWLERWMLEKIGVKYQLFWPRIFLID